jgi:hypothetical protein
MDVSSQTAMHETRSFLYPWDALALSPSFDFNHEIISSMI